MKYHISNHTSKHFPAALTVERKLPNNLCVKVIWNQHHCVIQNRSQKKPMTMKSLLECNKNSCARRMQNTETAEGFVPRPLKTGTISSTPDLSRTYTKKNPCPISNGIILLGTLFTNKFSYKNGGTTTHCRVQATHHPCTNQMLQLLLLQPKCAGFG